MTLRTMMAVTSGKTAAALTHFLKLGSGTNFPGKLARKIDPALLAHLGSQLKHHVIAITGTNGKTTTSGLLSAFLTANNQKLVTNQLGANMLPGIIAALVQGSDMSGKLKADCAVLEVDEASLKGVARELGLNCILVTNLFRDQLDRYGELDTTARMIGAGIQQSSQTLIQNGKSAPKLILNADDPLVTGLAKYSTETPLFFGIERIHYQNSPPLESPVPFTREVTSCPACQGELHYNTLIYGHLGHYKCRSCEYKRPIPAVYAEEVWISSEKSQVKLRYGENVVDLTLTFPGLFNVYNLLAATAAAKEVGTPTSALAQGLQSYTGVFGRAEKKVIQNRHVSIMLIKNPVGASEVLKLVSSDSKARLLVMLNDNYADGRDVSWIWDAQFEAIVETLGQQTIFVSGDRAQDMGVRLKYAGIQSGHLLIESDLKKALSKALSETAPDETLYILPTYTALLELQKPGSGMH